MNAIDQRIGHQERNIGRIAQNRVQIAQCKHAMYEWQVNAEKPRIEKRIGKSLQQIKAE